MRFELVVHLVTPGLDTAIREGAEMIARAILTLSPPPQIVAGSLTLDPQGDPAMANSVNTLPQHLTAAWTNQDGSPGTPTSVDYSLSDASLGSIIADAPNGATGATFTAVGAQSLGDETVTATAHQTGAPDVVATITFTLVAASVGNPIVSGTLTLDPQPPPTARRR